MILSFIGVPNSAAGRHALAVAVGALAVGTAIFLWPDGHRGVSGPAVPIVYVCTETNETFSDQLQSVPAVNPKTGHRTLVRGVYCAECNRWYASQPSNHRSGNPRTQNCRVHHLPMTYAGPTDALSGSETASP